MKRAISVQEMYRRNFEELPLEGAFAEALGRPEPKGVWFIWGNSGNGKTRFCLQLAKMLCAHKRVAYNTLEEGAKLSFQIAIRQTAMMEVARRFIILDKEPLDELSKRLDRRKSPDVVFIDSCQYAFRTKRDFIEFKERHPKKLIIINSHAQGKLPAGATADFIRYDADVKVRVEGYVGFPLSRYGGGKPYMIWPAGAEEYWQDKYDDYAT